MLSNFDEIADALWLLSQIMESGIPVDISNYVSGGNSKSDSPINDTESSTPPPDGEKPTKEDEFSGEKIYPGNTEKSEERDSPYRPIDFTITTSNPISSLDIQRVLRPLKRKLPSRSLPVQVDVEESLYQMAKNELANKRLESAQETSRVNLWQDVPAFKLGKEKWLDLILIIDRSGESVNFFENRISLLRRAILESGIFRHVFEYQMTSSKDGHPKFRKLNGGREYQLTEILGPTERKIFWVVSDCMSDFWNNWQIHPSGLVESIGDVFDKVGTLYPAAIIQLMPEELWSRTGLSLHELCKVWSATPLTSNKNVKTSVLRDSKDGYAIPILSLSPQRLSSWVDMITGKVTDAAVLSIFVRKTKKKRDQRPLDFLLESRNYDAVLDAFELTVPRQVRLYAAYLSVLPSMSFEEIWKLSKKITPSLSEEELSEIISNIISSKLFRFTLDTSEPKERIISELDTADRKSIRNKIPYSKQLEIMAEFYDCEIVPKFLDGNGKEIDFWLFISKSIEVANLDIDRVKEMYDVFQNTLKRREEKSAVSIDGVDALGGKLNKEAYDESKGDENENQPISDTPEKLIAPPLVNEMKINPVNDYSQTYLDLNYFDISLWGEKGCGKTSMLLSLPRQGALEGYNIRRVDHYGNLISSKHVHPEMPPVSQTLEAQDYLYYFSDNSGVVRDKLFCFHDFPGDSTTKLNSISKVSYKHSNAIFMFIDSKKAHFESPEDKKIRDNFYEFLSWLELENLYPYIAICLTKTDLLPNKNEETLNKISPWAPIKRLFGDYAVTLLQERSADVFSFSSWGVKEVWTPRKLIDPIQLFLKKKG